MQTTSPIKFGIRFGNSKRGTIITGITISDYIASLGATESSICPTGGWARIGGIVREFGITIY